MTHLRRKVATSASRRNQDEIAETAEPRDDIALISEDVPPLDRRSVRGDAGIEHWQLALCMPRIEVLASAGGRRAYARLDWLGQETVGDTRMAFVPSRAAGIEAYMQDIDMGAKAQRDLRGTIEHDTIAWIPVDILRFAAFPHKPPRPGSAPAPCRPPP